MIFTDDDDDKQRSERRERASTFSFAVQAVNKNNCRSRASQKLALTQKNANAQNRESNWLAHMNDGAARCAVKMPSCKINLD